MQPRIRVAALLRRDSRVLLIRHEKKGQEYWLLPGGGVDLGEGLVEALQRELREEVGIQREVLVEGPVAIADSIAPPDAPRRHVLHVIFAGSLSGESLELAHSEDEAVRGHRLFDADELNEVTMHPPIQRFVSRWRPGDPSVYLGRLWAP